MENILCAKKTINELKREMMRIRRLNSKPNTNYFNQCLTYTEPMDCWISESVCVFCWPDNGMERIYFYAANMEALTDALKMTNKGAVVDYITRDKDFNDTPLVNANYRRYMEYARFEIRGSNEKGEEMRRNLRSDASISKQLFENDKYGEPAQVSDAEEIDRQLREKFDPYEAHFYSLETLREHIKKGWVWIAKENGKIVGANLFEIHGHKCYGAYLYNNGSVEVLASLQTSVDRAIAKMGVNYYYCWMNLSNKRSLRYNIQYNGYVHDGTYNFIYVKS